ncbi:MAG: MFS transporter [Thaumarchaeota archaeon]|nr:MFS transporter [Nitrososphaerota archaeon]
MSGRTDGVLKVSRALLLDRNVRVIALTSLISGVYIGMLNTLLQPFTVGIGLGITTLGILQAVGGRFSGLTSSLIQPLAGHYADIFGRKVVVVAGSVTMIVSMSFFLLAALSHNPVTLLVGYLLYGLSALSSPASQAMVAESVNLEPSKMHVAFSTIFLLGTASGALMSFAAGPLVGWVGYFAIFGIAEALESVDLLLYLRELRETRTGLGPSARPAAAFSFRTALALPKGFSGFFATFAMDSFAFGITTTIIYGMLVTQFRYSLDVISVLVGTVSIATILAQYPATRLLLRVGPIKSLAISELFGCIMMAGWALSNSVLLFVLFSVFFGISIATWVPAQQSLVMTRSPAGERGSLGGKLAVYRGLVAFPAPIIGGFLYQTLGFRAPILASLAATVITIVMIIKLLPATPDDVSGAVGH